MDPSSEYVKTDIKATVSAVYKTLTNDSDKTEGVMIASDLEWWFHGPQDCHYMIKMLTGNKNYNGKLFKFEPRSIDTIGTEGAEAYWVHVWTVKDGVITQFREYFNTWLFVKDVKPQIQSGFISVAKKSKSSILWPAKCSRPCQTLFAWYYACYLIGWIGTSNKA